MKRKHLVVFLFSIPVLLSLHSCLYIYEARQLKQINNPKPPGYDGEWDPYYEWVPSKVKDIKPTDEQWDSMKTIYNNIPQSLLAVESWLDTTIMQSHCYKFLYSADSTRFVAFFIVPILSPDFEIITSKGRAVQVQWDMDDPKEKVYCGYTLWGMQYEGKWYYDKDDEIEFYDPDIHVAKDDYLYYILSKELFFKNWGNSGHEFWVKGGRGVNFLPLRIENYLELYPAYEGMPVLVGRGMYKYNSIAIGSCRERMKENLTAIRSRDTSFFYTLSIGKTDGYVMSINRSKALIGVDHTDINGKKWVSFFYFELENDTANRFWIWKQNMEITSSFSGPDIYKFYRQYIPEWTFNDRIIKDDSFWNQYITAGEDGKYLYLEEIL